MMARSFRKPLARTVQSRFSFRRLIPTERALHDVRSNSRAQIIQRSNEANCIRPLRDQDTPFCTATTAKTSFQLPYRTRPLAGDHGRSISGLTGYQPMDLWKRLLWWLLIAIRRIDMLSTGVRVPAGRMANTRTTRHLSAMS